jgi:hypothetical protein
MTSRVRAAHARTDEAQLHPLQHTHILQRTIEYVGAGEWYLVATVSKPWKACYEKLPDVKRLRYGITDCPDKVEYTAQDTTHAAICGSASRLRLARSAGAAYLATSRSKRHFLTGKYASKETLLAAFTLGLPKIGNVVRGAAESGDLSKLQWLYSEQGCPLPDNIGAYAAIGGSIDVLVWLKEQRKDWGDGAVCSAVRSRNEKTLQFLLSAGCRPDFNALLAAAETGQLSALQQCLAAPLYQVTEAVLPRRLAESAAHSGSLPVLHWIVQHYGARCELGHQTLESAAAEGHLPMTKHLHEAQGCALSSRACEQAALGGHVPVLRYLRAVEAPWNAGMICQQAALRGHRAVIEYAQTQQPTGRYIIEHTHLNCL